MRIAVYDLDRTLTKAPTFTPFLHFAALRLAPWRLVFSPLWIVLMLLYKAKFYNRTTLKRLGMRLMTGSVSIAALEQVGEAFARKRIAGDGWMPGALRLLEEDRAEGATLVVATAAFGFYAKAFAAALGIEHLIATRWDGQSIPGGNCYGAEKLARFEAWLARQGIDRKDAQIRFVSDSFADAPLLELADEAIFVTGNAGEAARAQARGWTAMDLTR